MDKQVTNHTAGTVEENRKVNISYNALYCLTCHAMELHYQSNLEEKADFCKPCIECALFPTCKADWSQWFREAFQIIDKHI